jgi:hypothetical protein
MSSSSSSPSSSSLWLSCSCNNPILFILGVGFAVWSINMNIFFFANHLTAGSGSRREEPAPPRPATTNVPHSTLQQCIDEYTTRGAWHGSKWTTDTADSPCQFNDWSDDELSVVFRPFKVGFMGDSTTRSDLRAFEEIFHCERTDLDEASVFQKKDESGAYLCQLSEQSINLDKCGVPPMVDMNCRGVSWRYFYKVYPMTPLDEWYLARPELFADLDVVVISLGRWFPYYEPRESLDVEGHFDIFITELKKVFPGTILYQSEYPMHDSEKRNILPEHQVSCPHAKCVDCGVQEEFACAREVTIPRPESDEKMRTVAERHQVPYLDRWDVSKSLPMEYFELWYCHDGDTHQWFCNHHLHFVAMQHLRLIANVMWKLLRP